MKNRIELRVSTIDLAWSGEDRGSTRKDIKHRHLLTRGYFGSVEAGVRVWSEMRVSTNLCRAIAANDEQLDVAQCMPIFIMLRLHVCAVVERARAADDRQ